MRLVPALVAAAVLAAAASSALAERQPEHMLTLGYQTEHADVVALARPVATTHDAERATVSADFEVERTLRGEAAAGDRLTVVRRDLGHAAPWTDGELHLVFLRRAPDEGDGAHTAVGGAHGVRRVVVDTPSARFPSIVEGIAASLGAGRDVADSDALRTLLARLATDADDGIAGSAALDLVRHRELRDGLTDAERMALVDSFRARRPGRARRQVAMAVAAAGHEHAAHALVDGLLVPEARLDRGGIAEALARLDDPRAEERLLTRLPTADPGQRCNLLVALGRVGGARAVGPVVSAVAAPNAAVRVEAAHALGNVARNIHRETPSEPVAGRRELETALELAAARPDARNETRAVLWALAQLDDPEAFALLRAIARSEAWSDAVRSYAERILERPRLTLLLD